MALVNLSSRANPGQAEKIAMRLISCPAYMENENPQVHHGKALLQAARSARPWSQGEAIADLFTILPLYGRSLQLQLLHAQALFNVSVITENSEETVRMAQKLKDIPAYESIGEVQFECAKMLSNAIAWATSQELLHECVAWIRSMSARDTYPPLAEAYARAERNVHRKNTGQVVPQAIPIGKVKMGFMDRLRGAKEGDFLVGVRFEGPEDVPPLELQVTATGEKAAETAARLFCDEFLRKKKMAETFRYSISYCRMAGAGKERVEIGKGSILSERQSGQSACAFKVGIEIDGASFDFAQVLDLTIMADSKKDALTKADAAAKGLVEEMRNRGMDIRSCKIIDITPVR